MRYYAQYNDSGKLIAIGSGNGGTEITEWRHRRKPVMAYTDAKHGI